MNQVRGFAKKLKGIKETNILRGFAKYKRVSTLAVTKNCTFVRN